MQPLIKTFPWARYSKKLAAKFDKLRCAGHFTSKEAEARDVHLAEGKAGKATEGNFVHVYWLVDKDDGIIIDVKFQAFGQSALLAAAEIACEMLIGKNYDQAKRVSAHLVDQQVQDRNDTSAFPTETSHHLNLVLEAIEQAAETCEGIPLAVSYVAPPMPLDRENLVPGEGYPGWMELSVDQKIIVIEEVLDRDIRPYIALDAGGVEVLNLVNGLELIIAYQGSCTSCYSSVGTTLSYIQQILRAKVHPNITVTPNL